MNGYGLILEKPNKKSKCAYKLNRKALDIRGLSAWPPGYPWCFCSDTLDSSIYMIDPWISSLEKPKPPGYPIFWEPPGYPISSTGGLRTISGKAKWTDCESGFKSAIGHLNLIKAPEIYWYWALYLALVTWSAASWLSRFLNNLILIQLAITELSATSGSLSYPFEGVLYPHKVLINRNVSVVSNAELSVFFDAG